MSALAFAVRFCPVGHALVGGECIACRKLRSLESLRDEREKIAKARAQNRVWLARSRAKARLAKVERVVESDPERSVCGIHRDTGATCERCAKHRVWLAKDLAATRPYHEVLREREARKTSNDGWMTNYLHRPWGEHHPEDRR